jgi:hypothetical protein
MTNKILTIATPVTQSREAVQSLIAYQNHGTAPAEMPPFYRLSADLVLVASNKGDAYYVTTPKSCTCPAAAYHLGQRCKHQKKYFPPATTPEEPTAAPRRLARPPDEAGSIRPVFDKPFRPFSELPSEEKAAGAV